MSFFSSTYASFLCLCFTFASYIHSNTRRSLFLQATSIVAFAQPCHSLEDIMMSFVYLSLQNFLPSRLLPESCRSLTQSTDANHSANEYVKYCEVHFFGLIKTPFMARRIQSQPLSFGPEGVSFLTGIAKRWPKDIRSSVLYSPLTSHHTCMTSLELLASLNTSMSLNAHRQTEPN
jgi:hypothetical protein